jgi:hypothetical protein
MTHRQLHGSSCRCGTRAAVLGIVLMGASGWSAMAQPATAPTATRPAVVPAGAQAMTAVVVKVAGKVQAAAVVESGREPEWRPVAVGERLAPGTQIRTGLRSSVLLMFGDNAIVKIDRVTSATVAQFYQSRQEQRIKLDLGYGAVRAGVAEGVIQSDMTIETPVATLTRRGTWNFGIEYEAVSGRFRIFVEDRGMVTALDELTNQRRTVLSHEYVTQAMIRWIETAKFDRQIPIQDIFGLRRGDRTFEVYDGGGLGVVDPGGGAYVQNVAKPGEGVTYAGIVGQQQAGALPTGLPNLLPRVVNRPEGNFGTGGAILPSDRLKKRMMPRRDAR